MRFAGNTGLARSLAVAATLALFYQVTGCAGRDDNLPYADGNGDGAAADGGAQGGSAGADGTPDSGSESDGGGGNGGVDDGGGDNGKGDGGDGGSGDGGGGDGGGGGGDGSDDGGTADRQVLPLYPAAGASWNDYLVNDGATYLAASDTACDGNEIGGYNACLHGGELRQVALPGRDDCDGVTAKDALKAFDWTCDRGTSPVRMVSSGLKAKRALSDLVDFDAARWKKNSLTVNDGKGEVLSTPAEVWWDNRVAADNDGGDLEGAGTIYLINSAANAKYAIKADSVALLVRPGVVLRGPGDNDEVVLVYGRKFLWMEGAVDAAGADDGVYLGGVDGVRFSVLRRLSVTNGYRGVALWNYSDNNKLQDVTVANNTIGLYMGSADNNTIRGLTAFNNLEKNLYVHNLNRNNTFIGVTSFSAPEGIYIEWSSDNIYLNMTVANIGRSVAHEGLSFFAGSDNNLLLNTAVVNSFASGIFLDISGGNTFLNAASANNGVTGAYSSAYRFKEAYHNYFTGTLLAGKRTSTYHCRESGGTDPGLVYCGGCCNDGPSDAVITNDVSLASAFTGKAGSDAVNQHGASGVTPFDEIVDWTHFSSRFRGWGLDGSAFPDPDQMDGCATGESCRVWDFTLAAADSVIRDALGPAPTGDDTLTHVWSAADAQECSAIPGAAWGGEVCSLSGYSEQGICEAFGGDWASNKCSSTVLRNAVEILDDRVGNENGLCESDETCLFTPNIGSYQGHGSLVPVSSIGTDTRLKRIELVGYSRNGY